MQDFSVVLNTVRKNKHRRDFPNRADSRYRDGALFPSFRPKFELKLGGDSSVFTIGSCFARNIEEALEPLGVRLPVRKFSVPKSEWPSRPNGLLNEYNPGAISSRIIDALSDAPSPVETIVPSGQGFADLLLPGGGDVSWERALERRQDISAIYRELKSCQAVIVTLGLVEGWFDQKTGYFLNRLPPPGAAKAEEERFKYVRMDVEDAMPRLEKAMGLLGEKGIRAIVTVSPVPMITTFTDNDVVVANEFSKSVLRICADRLYRKFDNVDYFPSFEIVRSCGLSGYIDDNVHVRDDLVRKITKYMVECYSAA